MTKKENIDLFLASEKIAFAGASRNPKKFGAQVFNMLKEKGYKLFPINPHAGEIGGISCFENVKALPADCKSLLIMTKAAETDKIVADAVEKGIQNIWIQQKSETKTAVQFALDHQVNLVSGECIFMFSNPVKGFHGFHRFMKKTFGQLPK